MESHVWHVDDVVSKYCDLEQVGRQRPLVSTAREGEQEVHWLKERPEQDAQSGWHLKQEPEEENVLDGQFKTHLPEEAS